MGTNAAAELVTRSPQVRGEAEMPFGVTVTTGVKGLRLRELGRAAEKFLGQPQQQFGNDCCDMVMAGKCLGSTVAAPGLACSSFHPITAGHLLAGGTGMLGPQCHSYGISLARGSRGLGM